MIYNVMQCSVILFDGVDAGEQDSAPSEWSNRPPIGAVQRVHGQTDSETCGPAAGGCSRSLPSSPTI